MLEAIRRFEEKCRRGNKKDGPVKVNVVNIPAVKLPPKEPNRIIIFSDQDLEAYLIHEAGALKGLSDEECRRIEKIGFSTNGDIAINEGRKKFDAKWEIDLGDGTRLLVLANRDSSLVRVNAQYDRIIPISKEDLLDKLKVALSKKDNLELLEGLVDNITRGAVRADSDVRKALVEVIDKLPDTRFINPIQRFVDDPASSVHQKALVISAKLQDREFVVPKIIEFLDKKYYNLTK